MQAFAAGVCEGVEDLAQHGAAGGDDADLDFDEVPDREGRERYCFLVSVGCPPNLQGVMILVLVVGMDSVS